MTTSTKLARAFYLKLVIIAHSMKELYKLHCLFSLMPYCGIRLSPIVHDSPLLLPLVVPLIGLWLSPNMVSLYLINYLIIGGPVKIACQGLILGDVHIWVSKFTQFMTFHIPWCSTFQIEKWNQISYDVICYVRFKHKILQVLWWYVDVWFHRFCEAY